jgi:hypothetical protein
MSGRLNVLFDTAVTVLRKIILYFRKERKYKITRNVGMLGCEMFERMGEITPAELLNCKLEGL